MTRATKYVALDLHQATTVASVRAETGQVVARTIVPTEPRTVTEFCRGRRGAVHVAFEEATQAQTRQPVPALDWEARRSCRGQDLGRGCSPRSARLLTSGVEPRRVFDRHHDGRERSRPPGGPRQRTSGRLGLFGR